MTDVKWQTGDVFLDSSGRPVMLSAEDTAFQRALLRLCACRGAFIYDRELGADWDKDDDALNLQRITQSLNEALTPYENTTARAVAYTSDGVLAEIVVDGVLKTKEVRHYGEL
ncbi:MAG: hypothetical protein IJ598_10260 [Ruminococcus sp.]|nr:hypothetical protein [Ruminococcus sp.]